MIKYFRLLNKKLLIRSYFIIFAFFITTILEILAIGTTVPLIMGIGDINSDKIQNIPLINKLDFIDNSEDEILNSCIEMINFKKNGFLRSEKSIFTQNKFWQQFEDNIKLERNIFEIREILNFGISDYFINKNAELLK